ncbi:glycosyltransferase family protein, partial [Desulfomarina sp.]
MRISFYCQHVLGVGHLHRSFEICRQLAEKHEVTLILGGPKTTFPQAPFSLLNLPGLQMDREFQNLAPCGNDLDLEQVKKTRKERLLTHFEVYRPQVLITELYPFGRKAFRFELDPVLSGIKNGSLPPCRNYSSVRDILVEKTSGKKKFEDRVIKILNTYYDGILIHADPMVITLDRTFKRLHEITIPMEYTGFICPPRPEPLSARKKIREKLGLKKNTPLIVASIGGGSVGEELLEAVIAACRSLPEGTDFFLQVFTGPFSRKSFHKKLQNSQTELIRIDKFSNIFPSWLEAADLSISMAGYNSCMNLLRAGIPALVHPFNQNRE